MILKEKEIVNGSKVRKVKKIHSSHTQKFFFFIYVWRKEK